MSNNKKKPNVKERKSNKARPATKTKIKANSDDNQATQVLDKKKVAQRNEISSSTSNDYDCQSDSNNESSDKESEGASANNKFRGRGKSISGMVDRTLNLYQDTSTTKNSETKNILSQPYSAATPK